MESNRRTFALDNKAGLNTVPAEALRFDAGRFKFADKKSSDWVRPVSMLARTAEPIDHWYWGKVVHDMQGMKLAAPTLPIDYCHESEDVLGYLDKFDAGNDGLNVSGKLVQFQPDDRVAEICHKADAGVPYQASIFFDPSAYVLECVPEGYQVTVNGYQLQGPACIVREWTLCAVSICPCGADSGTRTKLSAAAAADVPVKFVTPTEAFANMSKTPPADNTPSEKPSTELTAETKPVAIETQPPAAPVDARAEFKANLAKFTAAFGAANGAQWAADGLNYEQGLEKHAAALATELTAAQAKIKDLETKLASVPRGEEAPVSFSSPEKHEGSGKSTPTKQSGLGNLAKFAAGIKLPTAAK